MFALKMTTSNVNNLLLFITSRLVGAEMQKQGQSIGLEETAGEPTGVRQGSSESRCTKTISLSRRIVSGLCLSSDFILISDDIFDLDSNVKRV